MSAADAPTVIAPREPGLGARLRELRRDGALLRHFARRLLRKRYARTWLGPIWLLLRPVSMIATQVLVFGVIASVETGGRPYLITLMTGFIAWTLFAASAYWATRSLELNRSALARLSVARLAILLAASWPALVDVIIVSGLFGLVVGYYALADGTTYLALGPATLGTLAALGLLLAFGLSVGLWLAVPAMKARDVRFTLAIALSLLMFATPVAYPLSAVPDALRPVAELNPLSFPVLLARDGLLGSGELPLRSAASTGVVLVLLAAGGLWVFLRAERTAGEQV
jgi:lipopolysaccharide transport system permease protein